MDCSLCNNNNNNLLQQSVVQMQSAATATINLNTSNNAIIFGKPKIITK